MLKHTTLEQLSVSQLMNACSCPKKQEYLGLSLVHTDAQSDYRRSLSVLFGQWFGHPLAPEKVESFILENEQRSWYKMDAQYEILIKEEAAYYKRMASYFVGEKKVAGNTNFTAPLSLTYGSITIDNVCGSVCAIMEEETESPAAVILADQTPKYSHYARKMTNRPEYAPELLAAYLGLYSVYGRNLKVSIAYLRKKEDDPFSDVDPRKQIVTADFSSTPLRELEERLRFVLQSEEATPDCTACIYAALCTGMSIPEKKEIVTKTATDPVFTESQSEVVNFKDGACAVYAVPGAGKTTTLVYRLCKLLEDGVDPKSILFVTFTNKAADEIRSRVKALLHTDLEEELPDIYTYNGLGWQILRDHPELTGDIKLITPMDEKRILLECMNLFPERLKGFSYRYIEGKYGLINLLKRSFKQLEEDEEAESASLSAKGKDPAQIRRLKDLFTKRLKAEHYIDFDEQITLARKMLEAHPDIRKVYGQQWKYIMADEFQDSSQDNVDLLYGIADAGERNLVVVGDTDQSIFEWRDGSPKHLLNFPAHYPGCKQVYMKDNFRSVRQILDASNHLIARNTDRIDMFMVAHKQTNALPCRVKGCSLNHITTILELLRRNRYQYGDVAILARTNAPLTRVKTILSKANIDSLSPSDYLLYDSFFILVKDILDMYFRGFSETDMEFFRFMEACQCELPIKYHKDITYYENLVTFHKMVPIDPHSISSMLEYAVEDEERTGPLYIAGKRLFHLFCSLDSIAEPISVIQIICNAFHADEDSPVVQALKRRLEYQSFSSLRELWEYLNWMVDFSDETRVEYAPTPEKVNLMTAHSSKGKEFPAVIILQSEDFKATEEERRLFYVAMTRAKKCLFALESPASECELLNEVNNYMQTMSLA